MEGQPKPLVEKPCEENLSIWDHFYTFCGCRIKIHEDYDAGLGGTLFDGALCLCNYLETRWSKDGMMMMKGKDILELGAGCGLPGILTYKLGANVVLTDLEETIELLEENIENNGGCEVSTEGASQTEKNDISATVLDWKNQEDVRKLAEAREEKPFDYILAADTVYNKDIVPFFLSVLDRFSGPTTKILFAHPAPREQSASDWFWNHILTSDESLFKVEKVPAQDFVPNFEDLVKKGKIPFQDQTNGVFVLMKR